MLVLCGIAISLIPGLPVITMSSEVIFLLFLPPLLYEAAWNTSWHEFKAAIRPISLAAVGLVIFTTASVAVVAHAFIPGMSWPLAFLLGAIVSPPDAVAATSITKGLGLQPRIIAIIEGESLVNDASALICYKYALTAITAGSFVLWEAELNFIMLVVMGVAVGLAVGYVMYLVHSKFVCDPTIEVSLTFLTPLASYLLAENFHVSGVLAVVTTGLYLSYRSGEMLSHQSRIMAVASWQVVVYVLNGLIFILLGLQLPTVIQGLDVYSTRELIAWGVAVSFVVIAVRFIWVYPSAKLPRWLSKRIREKEPFDPKNMVVFGWAGMRGVVSMAAALAIPVLLPDGTAFPLRNLIIFLTFCVILSTLVLLGSTLPWVIRLLKIKPHSIDAEEYDVRTKVVTETILHIEDNLSLIQDELLRNIKSKYEVKYNRLQRTDLPANYFANGKTLAGGTFNEYTKLQLDLLKVERSTISKMHRQGTISQEILRKIEMELDLEETRLNMEIYKN